MLLTSVETERSGETTVGWASAGWCEGGSTTTAYYATNEDAGGSSDVYWFASTFRCL